jgi:glycosyltransferase involved in cell wall biosynthesis
MHRTTKICHLITRMILGGAQENTLLTLQGLRRDTPWEIHLAYGPEQDEGSLVEEAQKLGVVLHPLKSLKRNLNLWDDLRAHEELLNFFRDEDFDLVHTHSSKAGVLGRIAARGAGIPRIVHTIHGLAFDDYQPCWKNAIYVAAEQWASENCDFIIGVCQTMIDQALAEGIGSRSAMRAIYSGFPLDSFLSIQPRSSDNRFVIGLVARMFELKGHEDLMKLAPKIFQHWEDVDFLVVGDGPLRQQWDAWLSVHSKWKSRIQFVGRVAPDQVAQQIQKMDLVLHLSWREGLARVIPQALAAARPVCVYDIGGASEVVENGKNGWIVRPGDLKKIEEVIEILKSNRSLVRTMGECGRERVRNRFAVETMQREILKVYQELGLRVE